MLSPRRASKLAGLADRAVWGRLRKALEELDQAWDSPERRRAALRSARALAEQALAAGTLLPPGCRDLARRLDAGLERRELLELIVPLERALDRTRRDEDFLPISDRAAARGTPMPVEIVADSLRSAFNVGGAFRTAECFGARRIWLTGYSADPAEPRVARAAMGTERAVPWSRRPSAEEAIAALRAAGTSVLALETGPDSLPLSQLRPAFPCALVIGNERFGLAPAVLELADRRVCIPTHGAKASLNVVAALAIALHELRSHFDRNSA